MEDFVFHLRTLHIRIHFGFKPAISKKYNSYFLFYISYNWLKGSKSI